MRTPRVAIVGAGVGGLAAATALAARDIDVVVCERAERPGGKMREARIGETAIDAGPTVFTMRSIFEEIFAEAGADFSERVTVRPLETLARHAWSDRERLDLFSDIDRSADAIGTLAGAEDARNYRSFCIRAQQVYETLDASFIRSSRPTPFSLAAQAGLTGLGRLLRIAPFETMWRSLERQFRDPRLRQLFGRYATYCGSSPFQSPATLMLVAHVERTGVWTIDGGMRQLARALAALGSALGARFRYGAHVAEIVTEHGRAAGVRLESGERIEADAVIVNADAAALANGLMGPAVSGAIAPTSPSQRSLSAMTWTLVARTEGFPLSRHSVFFSPDYPAEFADIFERGRMPQAPTVYVCAQDRDNAGELGSADAERLLCLINAPPVGDRRPFDSSEMEQCEARMLERLERCGLTVHRQRDRMVTTTPTDFHRLYPATGGALYGRASHGWMASFQRPAQRTAIPGLYLAGGSTHPGPGVPMAALSGRMAAASLLEDLASMRRSAPVAMPGGTSMR
jgi:1-hydroxycarotenoid 3,4-desaturase